MKIYKTQEEIERDIEDGVLTVEGDVTFERSFSIEASIVIDDGDIKAGDIDAWNINARNIDAWNIKAGDINARNIDAGNINAVDINAVDIDAWNINAVDIKYYAVCVSYKSIKCQSIEARRTRHHKPICLDGELSIKDKEEEVEIKVEGKTVKISRKSAKALNLIS